MINWQLSKQGIRWPVPTWPYVCWPIVVDYFLRLSTDKLLVSKWSQAQVQFFKMHRKLAVFTSCTNKILISNWPRTRKFSHFLQEGKPWVKIKILTRHGHAWPRSKSNFYALIGQNLTGEFMRKTYAVSRNLFTDSWNWQSFVSSCDVLTVFFHWLYKMKYSCFQDSSVIRGWFVYWFLVGKCAVCQSHRKSN